VYANFGESPKGEVQHSPTPIGPGPPKRDAHIAGYYVLVYTATRGRTGQSGWERAKGIGTGLWVDELSP
jgi:hypothetical protein